MSPAKALAYWWSSLGYYHNLDDCNIRIGTRPERDRIKEVMTIYDATPYRYSSVETNSIRHPSCIVTIRDSNYATGWSRMGEFLNQVELLQIYQQTVDEGSFQIGHGTIRTGPVFAGHIPQENLELFTATVSFQFGFNQNTF